jgi:hypothetical protein
MDTSRSASSTTIAHSHHEEKIGHLPKRSPSIVDEVSPPIVPPTDDPNAADLSFPFQSTNINEGGMTDEYRVISDTGFISPSDALRPIPSHGSAAPPAVRDPEKARKLKDVKLVTFVPNDPEDPRNYSKWFKWCKY